MVVKPITIYAGAAGVDNVHREDDIRFSSRTGVTGLAKGVNVVIESSGKGRPRCRRANGYSELFAGSFHSGWRDTGDAFVGYGTGLYRFRPERTLQLVRSGMTGARICYAQHGEKTYFGNGTQNGVIENGVYSAWPTDSYLGMETLRAYTGAPIAKKMCIHNGRIFIVTPSDPNTIYCSEYGMFNTFFPAENHQNFESAVIMMVPVKAGIFVSSEHNTWFMRGQGAIRDMILDDVKDPHPAIEWSEWPQKINVSDLGDENLRGGHCRLWRGKTGAIVGFEDGSIANLTENMIDTECGSSGASCYMKPYFIHSAV